MASMVGGHLENFVWCAIGAALGALAGMVVEGTSRVARIESILVGVFGAFSGAGFVVSMLWGAQPGLGIVSLMMAAAGAIVALSLLHWMRRAVGPLKPSRKRTRGT